jgi:hypothetical protein
MGCMSAWGGAPQAICVRVSGQGSQHVERVCIGQRAGCVCVRVRLQPHRGGTGKHAWLRHTKRLTLLHTGHVVNR